MERPNGAPPPPHRYLGRRAHLQPSNFNLGPTALPRDQQLGNIQTRITKSSETGRYAITITDQQGTIATITTACSREALPQLSERIRGIYLETRDDPKRQIRVPQIRIMTMMLIMEVLKLDPTPTAALIAPKDANDDGRWALRLGADRMKIEVRAGSDLVGLVRLAIAKRAAQAASEAVTPTAPFPAISAPPASDFTPAPQPASAHPAASPKPVRRRPNRLPTAATTA